ncbi:MAG: efflux RND transporter periplasmic adaptor subunit [Acidobacteriaceae bacterium]|nr:efflux RND transporter periplasmic adaptor subunit [Acidobacteriaceae bacterium]
MSLDGHKFNEVDPGADGPASNRSPVHGTEELKREAPNVSGFSLGILAFVVLVILAILAIIGILKRKHSASELSKYTAATSAPPVSVQTPVLQKSSNEIVIPGNMQAFTMAPIYARTTGYVKIWYHDIGSHVKKGELLAIIETPELDQQLMQAKADLATAQSNASLAKTTSSRYKDLVSQNAVSQQDTDNAASQLEARQTEVNSALANVHRLEELQGFERITAPFDGVITARNLDVGQLITANGATVSAGAGVTSGSKEIFDIAAVNTLRVYVNIPQVYSPDAKNGAVATLTLPQYPGRKFEGKLVRSSDAVDPTTRTLLAEVDVNNKNGELLPGSYTEVHLHTATLVPALIVPVSALILDPDGLKVGVVDAQNKAHLIKVTSGRDLGSTVEILNGLSADQKVISNPPDSLTDGEAVRVVNSNEAAGGKS